MYTKLATLALTIVLTAFPTLSYAEQPSEDPDPVVVSEFLEEESDDLVELMPERCDQPGIVKNRSSFVVLIKGDYAGKPYEFQVRTLYPGQDSDKHTDMCDVDYFTVPTTWWFNIDHRHAHQWSPYISYNTFVCYDKEYVENEVWCRYE